MNAGTPKVAVVLHMLKDQPWGQLVKDDLEAGVAGAASAVALEFADSNGSAAEQLQHLEASLAKRPSALVVVPIDAEAVKRVLQKYRAAGIPVIVIDNEVDEPELYRAVISPDNRVFGRKVGEFFVEASGGRADLVELRGIPTTAAARGRSEGFREAIAGRPGIRIVESLEGAWRYDRAREAFAACLARHPRLDGVFAQNDEMARGALDAAAEVGREDELLVSGVDAIKGQGLSMVMQGRLGATVVNPSPGRAAAVTLLAILLGEPFLARTSMQTSLLRSKERLRRWQAARAQR